MKKKQSSKFWSNEKLYDFYKNVSHSSIKYAMLQDPEMSNYLYALCFWYRGINSKKVYFEDFDKDYVDSVIRSQYLGFMKNCEQAIEVGDVKIFNFIFKDSDYYKLGGVSNVEEALYAMRDEILGALIFQNLKNVKDKTIIFNNFENTLEELFLFNPEKHTGKKSTCYRNNFMFNRLGHTMVGTSMLFQNELNVHESRSVNDLIDFDVFCDKFNFFMENIMGELEIDLNSEVTKESFQDDNLVIFKRIIESNYRFYNFNYELVDDEIVNQDK